MILAHHLIFTLYGWWLPNDPRGSSSQEIRNDLIADLGDLHQGRKRLQPCSSDIREFYERAKEALQHELKLLDARSIQIVARAFAEMMRNCGYTCYACAIMPDHVHMVIRKHRDKAEQMVERFQVASRAALISAGLWPVEHPVWGGPGWKVFLDSADDIWRTIPYVEKNPQQMRLPIQRWEFVTPYDCWCAAGAAH